MHRSLNRRPAFLRQVIMLIKQEKNGVSCLLVGRHRNKRFFIIGNLSLFPFGGIYRSRDIAKHLMNLALDLCHIHISNNDDRLLVRTIPFPVIGSQFFRFEILNHLDCTDRHPIGVTASRIHLWQLLLPKTGLRILPCAPLLTNHATFLCDSRIGQ